MIKVHFTNYETIETEGTLKDIIEIYKQFAQKPAETNLMCLNDKYIFDIKKVNYIEEVK